ncbi:helix-turn-helix domain-containing protein [Couchioplanes azureus]|uniref:helix-turn-helix domain-containing protein n=1 Tax=Couchioplanes caeruleus TaxID=56438 RepID=UPI001670C474|nr:AraC family transcriptional regulator [Couchioplanes caeruleus]GGQ49166.1 hypothetical protein GCM10010166_16920 [Couchioplanes caeruleus subsp. azureus]
MSTATEAASNDTRVAHLEAVTRAIGVMRSRLAHPQPLRTLADVAAFSPFYFHQIFRQVTTVTPARFLAALRMAEARRLLLHSNLPVRQVGALVGYTSPGTFSAQFAQLTGTPPSRFRTQARALGDVRAAGARWWTRSRPAAIDGPVVTLSRAPDPGSLVCVCLLPAGSLRVHRGRWTPSTGSPWIPLGAPPPCGEYAVFCVVIPAGARVVDALVDDVPGSLRIGRAALSVPAHPPPATVRTGLRRPAPTDPPVTALLPLARPPGAAG